VADPDARLRLAQIRPKITITNTSFDPQLIAGLAAQGELQIAADLYARIADPTDVVKGGVTRLSWRGAGAWSHRRSSTGNSPGLTEPR
jgi:hypothetical protein